MSIVAVHGPNMFGSKSIVANQSGSAYAIVNPSNGLIWTFNAKDQSQVAANYDWAYTGLTGVPATPIADTKSPTITFSGAGTATVTLTLNGVAQPPITVKTVVGVAPKMMAEDEARVSQFAEGPPTAEETAANASPAGPTGDGDTSVEARVEALEDASEVDVGYDPAAHSVADVQAYVNEHPDQAADLYDAEVAGKNRATLVNFLEGMIPFDPAEYSVADVVAYAQENPEEVSEILEAEREGKGRTTLIRDLEAMENGE